MLPLAIAVSEAVTDVSGLVTRRTISMVSIITSSACRRDGHVLDGMRQHGLVVSHGNADVEKADVAGFDRIVRRHEGLAEQRRRPLIGLAAAYDRLPGMVGSELGTDGAVAVFLLDVGGAADELVGGVVIDEQGRVAAGIADRAIDDRVVLELGHLGISARATAPSLMVILASP